MAARQPAPLRRPQRRQRSPVAYYPPLTAPAARGSQQAITNPQLDVSLHDHQQRVVDFMLQPGVRGLLVWHGTGTGKTEIAIAVAHQLNLPVLVIATKSVIPQWRQRIRARRGNLRQYRFYTGEAFLRSQATACNTNALLIVDEVQLFRTGNREMSSAIRYCAQRSKKVMLLSATPIINSPRDIAAIINMITTQDIMPMKKKDWDTTHGVSGLDNVLLLRDQLHCKFSYYLRDDNNPSFPNIDFPDIEPIMMSAAHQKLYDIVEQAELQMLPPVDLMQLVGKVDAKVQAFLNGIRRVSNVAAVQDELHIPKFRAMVERVRQRKGPFLVYSFFIKSGIDCAETLLKREGLRLRRIDGRTSSQDRQLYQVLYNRGQLDGLLITKAGGLGMDLKHTDQVHIMERDWNEAPIAQVIGRAARHDSHPGPQRGTVTVFFYDLKKRPDAMKPDMLSADLYIKKLSEDKDAINTQFLETILPWSIEQQPQCMTQDAQPSQTPTVLSRFKRDRHGNIIRPITLITPPSPIVLSTPSPTPQLVANMPRRLPCGYRQPSTDELHAIAARMGIRLPPNMSVINTCSLLAKQWPRHCFTKGWLPQRILGAGKYGVVYIMCTNDNRCNQVAKVQLLSDQPTDQAKWFETDINIVPSTLQEFHNEVKMQQLAGRQMAPGVLGHRVCSLPSLNLPVRIGVLEMEPYDGNLTDWINRNTARYARGDKLLPAGKNLVAILVRLVRALHAKNIVHNDLHTGNVLQKLTTRNTRMYVLSDFGLAELKSQRTADEDSVDYRTLLMSIKRRLPNVAYQDILDAANLPPAVRAIAESSQGRDQRDMDIV